MPGLGGALLLGSSAATLAFYFCLSLGVLTRESPLIWCTKPLVMPSLLLWTVLRARGATLSEVRRGGLYAALVFSTLGDVFLIPGTPATVLLGIAAFGLAHVSYLVALLRLRHIRESVRSLEVLGVLAFAAYVYILYGLIRGGMTPELRVPLAIYTVLVVGTGVGAFLRLVARGDRASGLILAGAVLFLLSDSLIAVRRFGHKLPFAEVVVMATYIVGQFLIARGATEQTREGGLRV